MDFYTYILECSDKTLYTGVTSNIKQRLYQHEAGHFPNCYTYKRRPVRLVFLQPYSHIDHAIDMEKRLKGWSRKKKWALINRDVTRLKTESECRNETHFKNKGSSEAETP